jgi:hypothetical protein
LENVDVILDVDETAEAIAFGVHLEGSGRLWLDDVQFEKVDENVPATFRARSIPRIPTNLNFDLVDPE